MRKSVLYPALALGLGALGALLRIWQRAAGYDMTGLPIPFALPSIVLTVFLILCAGAAVYVSALQNKTLEDQSAALPRGQIPAAALAAAGGIILLGGVMSLLSVARAYLQLDLAMYASATERGAALRSFLVTNLLSAILALVSVPTAAALLLRARQAKSEGDKPAPFAVMMPPIFCWLWLIEVYRRHTSNPILWDYVLLLLASVALLISAYERAGFAFGAGKPRRTLFSSLTALMLAPAALPDCGGITNAAFLIALALHAAVELNALLGCFEYRPKRLAPDVAPGPDSDSAPVTAPAPDDSQSTQQEDVSHEQ